VKIRARKLLPSEPRPTLRKKPHSEMGPAELLSEHMDSTGNPVPDPSWGPTRKPDEDADLFEAMNAETSDFEHE
jgi:hypothetical protein